MEDVERGEVSSTQQQVCVPTSWYRGGGGAGVGQQLGDRVLGVTKLLTHLGEESRHFIWRLVTRVVFSKAFIYLNGWGSSFVQHNINFEKTLKITVKARYLKPRLISIAYFVRKSWILVSWLNYKSYLFSLRKIHQIMIYTNKMSNMNRKVYSEVKL